MFGMRNEEKEELESDAIFIDHRCGSCMIGSSCLTRARSHGSQP